MSLITLLPVGTILLGIASLSLYLSYHYFTSPAFSSEFGFAFKNSEAFDGNQAKELRKRGVYIEFGRLDLFIFMAIIMFHSVYLDPKLPRGLFAWFTRAIFFGVITFLFRYHFMIAPKNLKDSSS